MIVLVTQLNVCFVARLCHQLFLPKLAFLVQVTVVDNNVQQEVKSVLLHV